MSDAITVYRCNGCHKTATRLLEVVVIEQPVRGETVTSKARWCGECIQSSRQRAAM